MAWLNDLHEYTPGGYRLKSICHKVIAIERREEGLLNMSDEDKETKSAG